MPLKGSLKNNATQKYTKTLLSSFMCF